MARMQIDMPKRFIFSTKMQIRIGDCASGIHLGNHHLVSYLNEAMIGLLKANGFTDLTVDGNAFINADLAVTYLSESSHGDVLNVQVAIGEYNSYGCDLLFQVFNEKTGAPAATAKMGMLFFDYNNKQLVKVPDVFKETFDAQK